MSQVKFPSCHTEGKRLNINCMKIRQWFIAAFCVLLVLPPGWCSGFCPLRADRAVVNARKITACCNHCRRTERESSAPATPGTPSGGRCCCQAQDWSKPPQASQVEVNQAQGVESCFLATHENATPPGETGRDSPFSPDLPHRILHCVWRC